MHAAPPVGVSLGRSPGWIGFVGGCAGAAAMNVGAWALLLAGVERPWVAVSAFGLFAAGAAARVAWRAQVPDTLNWDGAQWRWAGLVGQTRVALDFDAWMLLCFEPELGRSRWIAASRRSAAGSWTALRAALHARRPADRLDAPSA
jgi:hypothetical protein